MLEGLSLDPYVVLGVGHGASAEEIREAYHRASKKHHPDHGGDEWAFKIVVRAYQALAKGPPSPAAPPWLSPQPPPARPVRPGPEPETGRIRTGVHDRGLEPARVVLVEVLWMRYEVQSLIELLGEDPHARNLSGSLNVIWPDPEAADLAAEHPQHDAILKALNAAFDDLRARTPVVSARSQIEDGRFEAWLGYPNGPTAYEAFKHFHVGLKARGLGVRQWTRDVIVPREPAG